MNKKILDTCCGSRMMWFNRNQHSVIYGDIRSETLTITDRSHGNPDGKRVVKIQPDELIDFRCMPYPDDSFYLVAFDPPHLIRAGTNSWMAAKYGKLQDWRNDLKAGFGECFRVLKPNGTLIFKWNETQVKLRDVLSLSPVLPLFGNTSGRKNGTHWIVFMKPDTEVKK